MSKPETRTNDKAMMLAIKHNCGRSSILKWKKEDGWDYATHTPEQIDRLILQHIEQKEAHGGKQIDAGKGKGGEGAKTALQRTQDAKARKAEAEAELIEIELARAKADIVTTADCADVVIPVCSQFTNMLTVIDTTLPGVMVRNIEEAQERVTDITNKVRNDLHKFIKDFETTLRRKALDNLKMEQEAIKEEEVSSEEGTEENT